MINSTRLPGTFYGGFHIAMLGDPQSLINKTDTGLPLRLTVPTLTTRLTYTSDNIDEMKKFNF